MSLFLPIGNTDYGFRDAGPIGHALRTRPLSCSAACTAQVLPDGPDLTHNLATGSEWSFAITGDYAAIARNHCAATMLTNAVRLLCPDSPISQDRKTLFADIHRIVGNGPILRLQCRANRYFRSARLPLQCEQIHRRCRESRPDRLVALASDNLTAGRPVALLVAASPLRWHWVLALPTTAPSVNGTFLITDGWHARHVYTYTADQGARLMAICRFTNASLPHAH